MFKPIKITFEMDGTGVYYDPFEPIMLDGLLSAALCRFHIHGDPPARDDVPFDVPLPLRRWSIDGVWGWHASALFPQGESIETLQHWRKRFRQGRAEFAKGSPNLTNGVYRDWNMPLPLLMVREMVCYAYGDAKRIRQELRRSIKYLGKKRAHGRGAVVGVRTDDVGADYSLVKDGMAMRWLPAAGGSRKVRTRPPYWNGVGVVVCCEIGDAYMLS
jgi:hypothetical protein